jgi:hypothetical protein
MSEQATSDYSNAFRNQIYDKALSNGWILFLFVEGDYKISQLSESDK